MNNYMAYCSDSNVDSIREQEENIITEFEEEIDLKEINKSIQIIDGYIDFLKSQIENLKENNKLLSNQYNKAKKIIDNYNKIKEKGSIKSYSVQVYVISMLAIIGITVFTSLPGIVISELVNPEISQTLIDSAIGLALSSIPVSAALSGIISPLIGTYYKSSYKKLNMTEKDLKNLNKKIEKNNNKINVLNTGIKELDSSNSQLKEISESKTDAIDEQVKEKLDAKTELINSYEENYDEPEYYFANIYPQEKKLVKQFVSNK